MDEVSEPYLEPSSKDAFEDDEASFVDNNFNNFSYQRPLLDEENDERLLFDPSMLKIPHDKRIMMVDDEPFNILGMQVIFN